MFNYLFPNTSITSGPEGHPSKHPNIEVSSPFSMDEERLLHSQVRRVLAHVGTEYIDATLIDDLEQIAAMAFIEAKTNYQISRGVKLSTLQTTYARNAIINYLKSQYQYNRHRAYPPKTCSPIDDGADHDNEENQSQSQDFSQFHDIEHSDPSIEQFEIDQVRIQVRAVQKRLTPRQRDLIRKLFYENCSQQEVAVSWGVSKSLIQKEMHRIEKIYKSIFPSNPFQS